MSASDDELFAQAMACVHPMRASDTSRKHEPPKKRKPTQIAVQAPKKVRPIHHMASPHEDGAWVLRANGITPDDLKKLANGSTQTDQSIDLHGETVDAAIIMLEQACQELIAAKGRVLRVIHGRGLHSPNGEPILKQAVYAWLRCGPLSGYILAAIPCPKSSGGACLILFRRDKRK